MLFESIRGILQSSLSAADKLAKIGEIVSRMELIDEKTREIAQGREATIQDHLQAIREVAREQNIDLAGIKRNELKEHLETGIQWLKDRLAQVGAWQTGPAWTPMTVGERPPEDVRPPEMLFTAPWEICLTISVFQDWMRYFRKDSEDPDMEAAGWTERGKGYLREVQKALGTGGVGDSIWLPKVDYGVRNKAGNTMETALALNIWSSPPVDDSYLEAIDAGWAFLKRNRNADGGWGFKAGYRSGIKSTSMAVMGLLRTSTHSVESPLELAHEGLKFLLESQREDGSWPTARRSRDNAIFSSFYAIEAFLVRTFLYHRESSRDAAQLPGLPDLREQSAGALSKALNWYQRSAKFLQDGDTQGWGWEDKFKRSRLENTAAALIILLDTGWMSDDSPLIKRTLEWLFECRDPESLWGAQTPLMLIGLMRILEPASRVAKKIAEMKAG